MGSQAVKGNRRYDASGRRRAAQARRRVIVDVALRRMLADGYAGTTVAAIAEEAGVSVETVYKGFGGKAGLVRAMWERGLAGEGPTPAAARSDAASAHLGDPREVIARWTEIGMEVAPRAAPILLMVRAAASADPDLRDVLARIESAALARMDHNARAIGRHLRPGVTVAHARDVLVAYTEPVLYDLLVTRQGWSLREYADFQRRCIEAQLL